jgi:hypothetical protein
MSIEREELQAKVIKNILSKVRAENFPCFEEMISQT